MPRHFTRARAHGTAVVSEPSNRDNDDWEDRVCETLDCEGHRWWFGQRVRSGR